MAVSAKRVTVTGGAGQIAYSLLFRLASGEMLGPQQPISLCLLDLPEAAKAQQGVKMELEDAAFPLLHEIISTDNPYEAFDGTQYALLVGAKPRTAGMQRSELLAENGQIFKKQGHALNKVADPNVVVLVVGNPCNTNCLIAMREATRLNRSNFHAMTRLDQNRALSLLAEKAAVPVKEVKCMAIWGNHSSTQVPDYWHARIAGKAATEVIEDGEWLEQTFTKAVQERGAAIIAARGKSSAASAASAAIDAIRSLLSPTPADDWFSTAICSDQNPYGIEPGLIFSFPCRSDGAGHCHIVEGLQWPAALKERVMISMQELIEERSIMG